MWWLGLIAFKNPIFSFEMKVGKQLLSTFWHQKNRGKKLQYSNKKRVLLN